MITALPENVGDIPLAPSERRRRPPASALTAALEVPTTSLDPFFHVRILEGPRNMTNVVGDRA
jgi:hypothetical protein